MGDTEMDIKYLFVLMAGIVISVAAIVVFVLSRRKKEKYNGGLRSYGMAFIKDNEYLKKRKRLYKAISTGVFVTLVLAFLSCMVLASRPHTETEVNEKQYARDIILCLDISTSVDDLNNSLIDELINTVRNLKGERFGIVIFNTSPVLVSPLTDDYEFIIEQLEGIKQGLEVRKKYAETWITPWESDSYYWLSFISDGTLIGNEERGSSLVGDGLEGAVYSFSDSEADSDREKLVIYTTDNDVYGDEIVPLTDAAQLCKKRNVVVFGIGTKFMESADKAEMKSAVESTGGRFYLEEESGTFEQIVQDIHNRSVNMLDGDSYVVDTDKPFAAFVLLVVVLMLYFGTSRILKK